MFTPSNPITGASINGLTTPTYTTADDLFPFNNGKQKAVVTLGGTQPSVIAHTISMPFTVAWVKPKVLKVLPNPNPITGLIKKVPINTHHLITRKGSYAAADLPAIIRVRTTFEIPAGVETYSPNDLKAALSMHIGYLQSEVNDLNDSIVTGVV